MITAEMKEKIALLEHKIRYTFKNKQLAADAITHSSYYNEHKKDSTSNERLEFLGDSVLSLMTCEYLYSHINESEGKLTKIKAALVCEESLYEFAEQNGFCECILLGKGEKAGGVRKSTLSDLVEAVLGAMFLDSGMETAKNLIMPFIVDGIAGKTGDSDYKTLLQEVIQKNKGDKLHYVITGESGPAHNKSFTCHVYINSNDMAEGSGGSKKEAEQAAAKNALILMGISDT